MTAAEIEACKDGYIYIHDMSARRDTMNCCLFDMANVLKRRGFAVRAAMRAPSGWEDARPAESGIQWWRRL